MKYVQQTLQNGEVIVHTAKLDWRAKFDVWILGVGVAMFGLMAVILTAADVSKGFIWTFWALTAFNVLGFVQAATMMLTTEMAVTNKRVIHKHGWIARKTKELKLDAFESAELSQGFWGRLFRCATCLDISGRGIQKVEFRRLGTADALAFKAAIEGAAEANMA